MKNIDSYISEKLVITKSIDDQMIHPKTKEELKDIITKRIAKEGNECDLNDIDVSKITDMSFLFTGMKEFNCDISKWDVSGVKIMKSMFAQCHKFNCDISEWDVSSVEDMQGMFLDCKIFNQDISRWDVHNVTNMQSMFWTCKNFNQDLSSWRTDNLEQMSYMFFYCVKFDVTTVENWNTQNIVDSHKAFDGLKAAPSWWNPIE